MSTSISKLKQYAECAHACYALFNRKEFFGSYNFDYKDIVKNISKTEDEFKTILNNNFSDRFALDFRFRGFTKDIGINFINQIYKNDKFVFLSQTEHFFERYSIVSYCPNKSLGFSATLFYDKIDYEYVLALRGTEDTFFSIYDFINDFYLIFDKIAPQYDSMIEFYEKKIKQKVGNNKLIVVGHSLGGALAQFFTLTFHNENGNNVVKQTYTFNSPGVMYHTCYKHLYIEDDIYQKNKYHKNLEYNLFNNSLSTDSYVWHIETGIGVKVSKNIFNNLTQHLGKDIPGRYLFINNNLDGTTNSHLIEHTVSTLYFYDYILKYEPNSWILYNKTIEEILYFLNINTIFIGFLASLYTWQNNKYYKVFLAQQNSRGVLEMFDEDIKKHYKLVSLKKLYGAYIYFIHIKYQHNGAIAFILDDINSDINSFPTNHICHTDIVATILNLQKKNIFIELNKINSHKTLTVESDIVDKYGLYCSKRYRIINSEDKINYRINDFLLNITEEYIDLLNEHEAELNKIFKYDEECYVQQKETESKLKELLLKVNDDDLLIDIIEY